jgi:hypothetical protein
MRLKKIEQVRPDEPVSDIRRTLSYRPEMFGQPLRLIPPASALSILF